MLNEGVWHTICLYIISMKKMTKKETRVYKTALLSIIADIMMDKAICKFNVDVNSYDKQSDMMHFTLDGHSCYLLGVDVPNLETGTMVMRMMAKGVELTDWENMQLNVLCSHFKVDTLEKIACEVYRCLQGENDMEWDDLIKGYIANYFDAYL